MAVDTETKRRSVSGYTRWVVAPLADGTVAAVDRMHIVGLYSGIAPASPGGTSIGAIMRHYRNRRST